MTSRRTKLFSPFARVAWLLVLAALAWLALRNAAIALFTQVQPSFALALPPASGEAVAVQAMRAPASPEQQEAAARALALSPISYWPVAAAAEAAMNQGDVERGTALLEEAVRRNSRQADTRGRLFQLYVSQGRWNEAIDEGLSYARIRSTFADSVMESFLLFLADVRGRAILARRLQPGADGEPPAWREQLVRLSAGRPGERTLAALVERADSARPLSGPAETSLEGYFAWVASLPDEALPHVRAVYDGEFRGLPGAAPFNWAFAPGTAIEAGDPTRGGTLVARASNDVSRPLARQLLVLPPGTYRLAVEANASGDGAMSWRISCREGAALLDLAVPRGGAPTRTEERFTVPTGCALQELQLIAAAAGGESSTSRLAIWPAL